jgi:hypothetical protein
MKAFRSQSKAMIALVISFILFMIACEEQQTNPIANLPNQGIVKDQMLTTKADLLLTQDQALTDLYTVNDMKLTPWRDLLDGTYLISMSSVKFDPYVSTDRPNLLFFLEIQLAQNQIKIFHLNCDGLDRYSNPAWTSGEIEPSGVQNDNGRISINLGKFLFNRVGTSTCFQNDFTIQDLSLHFNVSDLNQEPICGTVTGKLFETISNEVDLYDANPSENTKFKATRLTESEINAMAVIELNRASCTQ